MPRPQEPIQVVMQREPLRNTARHSPSSIRIPLLEAFERAYSTVTDLARLRG